jgi:hypothetical protein
MRSPASSLANNEVVPDLPNAFDAATFLGNAILHPLWKGLELREWGVAVWQ